MAGGIKPYLNDIDVLNLGNGNGAAQQFAISFCRWSKFSILFIAITFFGLVLHILTKYAELVNGVAHLV